MLLERLGLHRKALPLSEQPPLPASPAKRWSVRGLLFAVLVALTVIAFPYNASLSHEARVGEEWRDETLIAPFSFPILKDRETLQQERLTIRSETPPFFRAVPDALERMERNRDTLRAQVEAIAQQYADYQRARERDAPTAVADSARFEALRRDARVKLSRDQWRLLLDDYLAAIPDLAIPGLPLRTGPPLYEQLLSRAFARGAEMTNFGVINIPQDSVFTRDIYIRDENERVDIPRPVENVFGLNDAYDYARDQFAAAIPDDSDQVAIATAFFRALFQPSFAYLRQETEAEIARKERRLSPSIGAVLEGDIIIERGQRVTEDARRKISSLIATQVDRGGVQFAAKRVIGQVLLACAILFLFYLYLYLLRRQIFDDDRLLVLTTLVLGIIIGLFAIAVRLADVPAYAVPVAVASVLLTVLFDSRVGVFGTLSLALIGGHLIGDNFEFTFATLFACTIVVFSLRDIKNRGQIILASGLLFGGYLIVLATMRLLLGITTGDFQQDVIYIGVNAFLLLFSYPLLWVFERLFGVTTDLTLLELSNTNRPLLREMSQKAPGTFNHVLQVANLAEACADAVGANALLTRVGALYHDIGKMKRPEYFIENQGAGENLHDALPPALSAAYIIEHVTEGMKIGRQHRLPEQVLHFIPTHHGTTRVEFFYRKAIERRAKGAAEVEEENFRYPGPRPDSREAAILMLADSTEAASRALDDPTPENLARLVDGILEARVKDQQLDRSELTFSDLTRVRETLFKMLTSINHSRIKYPEPAKGEESQPMRIADGKIVEQVAARPAHDPDSDDAFEDPLAPEIPPQSKSEQDIK